MVPALARMMDGTRRWRTEVRALEATAGAASPGVELTVRSAVAGEAERLRALGFAGFLVSGDHHRPHHEAMALGAPPHSHR